MTIKPIVTAADGSPVSYAAVAWAAQVAARRKAPLRILNSSTLPMIYGSMVAFTQDDYDRVRADGEAILAEAKGVAQAAVPNSAELDVTTELVEEAITPVLIHRSETAQQIVLGSRGMGAIARTLVGSVSSGVSRHAKCPVAVIKDDGVEAVLGRTGNVLVGVDGSEAGRPAVAAAFEEASARGVELVALHAWTDGSQFRFPDMSFPSVAAEEAAVLSEALAGFAENFPDVTVRRILVRDRPGHNMLEESAKAQLVVVGSRGRGGFAGLLLGSTSQALLHSVECPILIAR